MSHPVPSSPRHRFRRTGPAVVLALALLWPAPLPAGEETPHSKTVRRRNTDCQQLITEKRLLGWDVSQGAETVNEARKRGRTGDLAGALILLEHAEAKLRNPRKWLGNPTVPRIIGESNGVAPRFDELNRVAAGSLGLGFDDNGRLRRVRLAERDPCPPVNGGFYVQDAVTGNTGDHAGIKGHSGALEGRVTELEDGIGLSGSFPGTGADLEARIIERGRHLEVEGTLKDTTGHDRALVLCFKIPVPCDGPWWDDADLAIGSLPDAPFILQNSAPLSSATPARRLASIYPLGCFGSLVLATAIDHPAVFRINYDNKDKTLNLYYDFGLTSKTARFPGQARFRFVIYALEEPEWGFRSALDTYYRIFPAAFAGRVEDAGLWGTVEAAEKLGEAYEQMGFAFLQGENSNPTWGKRLGLWSLRYCRPWNFFVPGPTSAAPGDLARLVADPGRLSVEPSHRLIFGPVSAGQLVRGAEHSAIHDAQGNPVARADRVRGGVSYVLNPDPEITGMPAERNAAQLAIEEAITPAMRNYRSRGQTRWGLFFDVAGSFLRYENFRGEHMATADYPLTFDETGKRPVILNISSAGEHLAHVRKLAAAEGGMVGVNTSPHPYNMVFLAPFCDMAGTEHLPGRREMNNRRALARHRPIGFRTVEGWEELLKNGLFYGVFPSRSAGRARTRVEHLEKAKALLTRVVPLIRTVSGAGWEPVTRARSGDPELLVERFGSPERGAVFFTVWNRSAEDRQITIDLDDTARGWFGNDLQAVELAKKRRVSATDGTISVKLEQDGVALVRLERAKPTARP